jgi:hypothetical protein
MHMQITVMRLAGRRFSNPARFETMAGPVKDCGAPANACGTSNSLPGANVRRSAGLAAAPRPKRQRS